MYRMDSSTDQATIPVNIVFVILALLSVALRLYARRRASLGLREDDWLVVAALTFAVALAINNIVGLIKRISVVDPGVNIFEDLANNPLRENLYLYFFIHQFLYILAAAFAKLSILCLYRRVFSSHATPLAITVLLVITSCWLAAFFFATVFEVVPVECNWEATLPKCFHAHYVNDGALYIVFAVTDIVLDLSILSLPVILIRNLQMSTSKRIAIASIFGLGIFCIIASIVRLVYTINLWQWEQNPANPADDRWYSTFVALMLWAGIEACMSTICASLPCYAPLVPGSKASSRVTGTDEYSAGSGTHATSHGTKSSLHPLRQIEMRVTNANSKGFVTVK